MNKKYLILHGWGGSDFPHWQSWLAGELAKNYSTVSFLKFSDFDFPDKNRWMNELKKELEEFKPDVVICHSIANILWFQMCHEFVLVELEKLYLVAPPSLKCDIAELNSFYPCATPTNLYAKESLLITSTNDPYLSVDEAKSLQKSLDIPMKILENAGHINSDSGYGEWPWILENIIE
ncbi:alpha/beta hydrolase [Sulfurimonas sp.]|uniref:RBBP9/YdeN family alpha/beta hydrolase n=1 Tax=Sulfurimonas sp. TaxID=2022749 RepID=UPI0025D1BCD3|nr:alpha/beta hydrolase [Sulfurimonas sp.]MDD5157807.1 alpha/beta hydrolase [Sulfurimonas sp.]